MSKLVTKQPLWQPKVQFIIAGTQKGGTTALWQILRKHPQIYMPTNKCQDYFISNPVGFTVARNIEYDKFFGDATKDKICGEASASYLFYPHALRLLRHYNPEMKMIFVLRDPVERAYSHWNMGVQKGREKRSFMDAVKAEHQSLGLFHKKYHYSYTNRGLYAKQCAYLFKIFRPDQLLFLRSDELRENKQATVNQVCQFLGVDEHPKLPKKKAWHTRKYSDPIDPADRAALIEFFKDDIKELEKMLDWDCSSWLK